MISLQAFSVIVLDPSVLSIARAQVKDILGFEDQDENTAFRYQAYRQHTLWVQGRLGRRSAKVVPSCCTKKIREKYPNIDGKYVPFFTNRDNI